MRRLAPLRPRDPTRLGAYKIDGRIGTGGQGVVYLARDPRDRKVAIKTLHADLADDEDAAQRFVRELAAAQRVAPFCTAAVLDADVTAERPYIVSEYVDGPSLQQIVSEQGPRTGTQLQELAHATATALVAIHEANVVHRDFKPHNVLLGPEGPRVIDFGIARALDGPVTTTVRPIGTPAYMAPEQIAGERAGPPADVFAWGGVIAFAATGRPAFGQDSIPAILERITRKEPDLEGLTGGLLELVRRCLAKDPAHRPVAREILDQLESVPDIPRREHAHAAEAASPDGSRGPGVRGVFEPLPTDDRDLAGDTGDPARPARDPARPADDPARSADESARPAGGAAARPAGSREGRTRIMRPGDAEDAIAMYNSIGRRLRESGRLEEAEGWFRRAADAGDTEGMNVIGQLMRRSGRVEEAERWYRRAAEAGNTYAIARVGYLLRQSGRMEEAKQWYRPAAAGGDMRAMNVLGELLTQSGQVEEAERWYRRAAEVGSTRGMVNLGVLLTGSQRAEEAESWLRRAAEAGSGDAMYHLGVVTGQSGRFEDADEWYLRAAEAGNADAQARIGLLHKRGGRVDEAESWLRRAAKAGNTDAMDNLGVLLEELGRGNEAEAWYRMAADAGDTYAMDNLGMLLMESGRMEEAAVWHRRAAGAGDTRAIDRFERMLRRSGRGEEADHWSRRARHAKDKAKNATNDTADDTADDRAKHGQRDR
jgi:serine/threonine protein kinase/TPR repeat protein